MRIVAAAVFACLAMQQQAATLRRQNFRIQLTVEKNQVHRLKAQEINLSNRLYDEIESCK